MPVAQNSLSDQWPSVERQRGIRVNPQRTRHQVQSQERTPPIKDGRCPSLGKLQRDNYDTQQIKD